jgi:phosphatidate cytidylyltransferase
MLKQRLISGLTLATILVVSFVLPGLGGAVFFLLWTGGMMSLGIHEFLTLSKPVTGGGFPKLTMCFAWLILLMAALNGCSASARHWQDASALLPVVFLLAGFINVFRTPEQLPLGLKRLFTSLAGLLLVAWCLSFIPALYFSNGLNMSGRWLAFFLILVTKVSDIGAYAAGVWSSKRPQGNHKLAPTLSPKKSWEGLLGGIAASMLVGGTLAWLLADKLTFQGIPVLNIPSALAFGLFAAIVGLIGDIAESCLKRAAGASDSGRIPGLGGALDVLDSLIFVAPIFYVWIRFQAG